MCLSQAAFSTALSTFLPPQVDAERGVKVLKFSSAYDAFQVYRLPS